MGSTSCSTGGIWGIKALNSDRDMDMLLACRLAVIYKCLSRCHYTFATFGGIFGPEAVPYLIYFQAIPHTVKNTLCHGSIERASKKTTEGAEAWGIFWHVQDSGYRAPVLRNLDINLLSSSPIKYFNAVHCSRTGGGPLSGAEASRKPLVCITPPLHSQQLMIRYHAWPGLGFWGAATAR